MKVFIFSNAKGWKASHAKQLGIDKKDMLVFCNTALPSIYPPLSEHKNKCLYIRYDGDHNRYFKCLSGLRSFKKVFYICGPKDNIGIHTYEDYPDGFIPSTGFILYRLLVGPAQTVLVNFLGPRPRQKLYMFHHWKFEKDIIDNDKRVTRMNTIK